VRRRIIREGSNGLDPMFGGKICELVYIFEQVVKIYLNSEIGINICVINNPDKYEIHTIGKPSNSFFEHNRGFGP
jgi:hypothetical protein